MLKYLKEVSIRLCVYLLSLLHGSSALFTKWPNGAEPSFIESALLPRSHVNQPETQCTFLFVLLRVKIIGQFSVISLSRLPLAETRDWVEDGEKGNPRFRTAILAVFTLSPVSFEIRHTFEILSCGSRQSFQPPAVFFEYVCRCYPRGKAEGAQRRFIRRHTRGRFSRWRNTVNINSP